MIGEVTTTSYVQGGIFNNSNGQRIDNVTVQVFDITTSQVLGEIQLTTGEDYTLSTDTPDELSLIFIAKGFQTLKVPFRVLMQNSDVTLVPQLIQPWMIAAVAVAVFAFRKKTGKVGKIEAGDVKTIALLVGVVMAFSIIEDILQLLGIWDSQDTKDLDNASSDPNSFWNPNYWQTIKPANASWTYAITESQARDWCREIYDSFGAFNDCEECVKAVFRRCQTRANASFICYVFNKYYGYDLLDYLRGGIWPQDRLSDPDVNEINQFINRLPKY